LSGGNQSLPAVRNSGRGDLEQRHSSTSINNKKVRSVSTFRGRCQRRASGRPAEGVKGGDASVGQAGGRQRGLQKKYCNNNIIKNALSLKDNNN